MAADPQDRVPSVSKGSDPLDTHGREPAMDTDPQDRVFQALLEGTTVPLIAAQTGLSDSLVATMLDHYSRIGLLAEATSLCASGLGACHARPGSGELSKAARVACAGCPLAR